MPILPILRALALGEAVSALTDELHDNLLPETTALDSSHLAAVTYEPVSNLMTITFTNGEIAEYPAVSRSDYEGLRDAASPGSYYWQNFRIAQGRGSGLSGFRSRRT